MGIGSISRKISAILLIYSFELFAQSPPLSPLVNSVTDKFFSSKDKCYQKMQCHNNITSFVSEVFKKEFVEKGEAKLTDIKVALISTNGNGALNYGKIAFAYHVILLIWNDTKPEGWYVLDYDLENMKTDIKTANKAIPLTDYIVNVFNNESIKERLDMCLNNNNTYVMEPIPKVAIFDFVEWEAFKSAPCVSKKNLIMYGEATEDWRDCLSSTPEAKNVTFNNLYEIFALEQKSLEELRKKATNNSKANERLCAREDYLLNIYKELFSQPFTCTSQ